MPGINMMPSGSTLQIPLDACTNFSGEAGNAQVTLTWTDPKDKYATPEGETAQDPDQLVSVWEYTQIIRKTGSQPTGPHDGELVVSSSVRDQYATTGFVDDGLTNDTLYYYAAFAYNTDGVASEGAFTSATPIAGTPLSELAEGTLIKIQENGAPVEFYVAKQDYESELNGAGRVLCVRKDVYTNGVWKNDTYAGNYGGSTILNWNKTTYFNLFSSGVKEMIATTKFYYAGSAVTESPVFNLSLTELGISTYYALDEGSQISIAPTISASSSAYWSRTKSNYAQSMYYVFGINANGTLYKTGVGDEYGRPTGTSCHSDLGYRPCFTLPSTALVDTNLNLIES